MRCYYTIDHRTACDIVEGKTKKTITFCSKTCCGVKFWFFIWRAWCVCVCVGKIVSILWKWILLCVRVCFVCVQDFGEYLNWKCVCALSIRYGAFLLCLHNEIYLIFDCILLALNEKKVINSLTHIIV